MCTAKLVTNMEDCQGSSKGEGRAKPDYWFDRLGTGRRVRRGGTGLGGWLLKEPQQPNSTAFFIPRPRSLHFFYIPHVLFPLLTSTQPPIPQCSRSPWHCPVPSSNIPHSSIPTRQTTDPFLFQLGSAAIPSTSLPLQLLPAPSQPILPPLMIEPPSLCFPTPALFPLADVLVERISLDAQRHPHPTSLLIYTLRKWL
jgi:hypothetical protein